MPTIPLVQVTPSIFFTAYENEFGNISLFGGALGLPEGTPVNFLFTDNFGNSKTVTLLVTGGELIATNIWSGMFGEGDVSIIATAMGVEQFGSVSLSGQHSQEPVSLTQNVLDENLMIDVQGLAPALEAGTVLTLVIRDAYDISIMVTTSVQADGSFSLQNIDPQGLSEGLLSFDVMAQDANGTLNLTNIATLLLTGSGPQGADNTLTATEDTAFVVNAAAFGYSSTQGHTLTGVKITVLPAQGTLKLNGVAVNVDDVISKADLDAGKLRYQGALNGNGSNYASLLFKVMDSRATNNEDTTANKLTFNVTAVNDAAIISGPVTGAVTEAGGVSNAIVGNPNATGTLTSTDVDGVANAFTAVTTAAASTGGYGTYTMTAAGVWAYTLNNANTTVQALKAAQTLTDTFTVTAADGTPRVVTVTITGSNDAAIISGATTGAINEGVATTTGTVTSTDVDGTANAFTAAAAGTASTSGYGTYALTSAGVWTYTLNNANTTVNALAAGVTLTDTFTVAAADGTSQVVTVTITGTNDAAIISGPVTGAVTEAGGVSDAIVGNPNATGTLTSTDVDGTANAFTPVSTATTSTGGYGSYTMTAAGVWAYTLNNGNTTVQALKAAQTLTDTFTVTAADGTPRVITITITGTNDAAIISGTSTGAVTEAGGVANATAGNPNATGTLTSTDVDGVANAFIAVTTAAASTGGYGTYTMNAAGVWAYTLNNGNTTVQALKAAQTLTDTFTVTAADGTPRVVTVTITGSNDAAVISGTSTASLNESNAIQSVSGTLTSTDVDGTANLFTAQTGVAGNNNYGTFSITTAGAWTYAMNTAHNEFVAGQVYTDSTTVTSADGTTQVIFVQIYGTNDAAIISGPITGAVTEAGGVSNAIVGNPNATGTLTSTDVDGTANAFTPVSTATTSTGGYGSYTMTAAGVWAYTLNNGNTTVQALKAAQTLTDTFTVTAADGTPRVITITITGTNDAAIISGTSTGAVTEASGVDNATAGNPNATGTLTSTDVDGVANAFTAVTTAAASTGGYGTYTMTAGGQWAYTLNNANTTVQALAAAATLTDTFTVTAADGTPRVVTVTITGANDAPIVALAIPDQVAILGTPFSYTLPTGSFTDVDSSLTYTATRGDGTALPTWLTFNAATRTFSGTPIDTVDFNIKVTASDGSASISDTFALGIAPVANSVAITGTTGIQNNFLNAGDTISATVNFTELVNVTGTPQITLNIGGTLVKANYVSGSGTSALTFSYTILAGQTDANGISINANSLGLNGGTIKDAVGNNATQDFALVADNISYKVDTTAATAVADIRNSDEDTTPITGNVATNDTNKDGTESYAIVGSAAGTYGTLTMNANGTYSYARSVVLDNIQTTAVETFTYKVTDAAGNTTQSTLTINMAPVNDAAVIGGDLLKTVSETNAAQTVTGALTITDVDSAQTFNALTGVVGTYGSFSMTTAGAWTYVMSSAQDQFKAGVAYTDVFTVSSADGTSRFVTITINGTNDAPVVAAAIPDQMASMTGPFSYTVPAGTFTDPDSTLTYTVTRGDGTALPTWVTFDPATLNFSGIPTDTIDFNIKVTASDGTASISDTFLVGIAPVASSAAITSSTGIQNNFLNAGDTVTTTVNFGENVFITGTPQITLNIGGTLVKANYVSGSGTSAIAFSYTILAGQTDANGISINANSLGLNGGTLKDAVGNNATQDFVLVADNISYKVDTTAALAVADSITGTEDVTTLTGSVATNDTGKDGSESYTLVGSATGLHGTLTLNTNGTYSYARTANLNAIQTTAVDTFTYRVTDAAGNSTTSTLTLNMTPVNDAPVFPTDVTRNTLEDTTFEEQVSSLLAGKVTDVDSTGIAGIAITWDFGTGKTSTGVWYWADSTKATWTAIDKPAYGPATSIFLKTTDYLRFVPALNADTSTQQGNLVVRVADNSMPTTASGAILNLTGVLPNFWSVGERSIIVNLTPVNDAPIVANQIADTTGLEGTALSYTLPANAFTDVDSPTLSYTFAVVDANGTALATQPAWLSFNATTRTFSGTPPAGSAGTVFVKVTASDGSLSANDTFNIVLTAPDTLAPTLVGSNPSDNGYVAIANVGQNFTLTFSEAVNKGTGLIQLFKVDGTLVESFDAASSSLVTGWNGNTLTINPTANLLAATGYYIKIAPTAVKDLVGNAYAGIADATTLNFTTTDASGAIVVPANGVTAIEDLSTIGDFNGDGYDDFVIGAGMNGLSSTGGAAFVVYGNANGTVPNLSGGTIAASAGFKIVSGFTGDYFGIAVNSAGDTNGDGLADLVVTAKYGDPSFRESAYVVFGKSNASTVFATGLNVGTGLTASMGYQIKIDEAYWGQAVSNAGDVNGDGLSDLLVISDTSAARNVYVIYGKTGNQSVTLTSYTQFTPDMGYNVLTSNVIDLGQSVYGAGDVNGDGLSDFIVGAPNSSTGARGMAYVVYGNSTGTSAQLNATNGIDASQGFRILGQAGTTTSFSYFGFAVSSAGDVNGDGLADVMISSPFEPGAEGGAVYVVYGNSSGSVLDIDLPSSAGVIAASRGFKITSALAADMLGRSGKDIASAGDINGDGLSDMIISGRDDNGNTTASTYVVYGNASGTSVAIDASGNIAASNGFKLKGAVGFAVASAGDINGDGLNDLLVSARLSGVSGSYNVVLGGTQWVTAALDGAGTFSGTSGDEALIGSTGNDTITGGGGVDRFFAGRGDDTIVLTASDIANLQNNSTGQTAKATVSAGTGFDTIRLSGGASLDLLKVSNAAAMGIDETSRIEGIERIDMATDTAANTLKISNKDINDMAGFNQIHTGSASADGKTWTNVSGSALSNITSYHQMVVDGGSTDTVALTANGGAWANVGTVSNGTTQYTVYQNTATQSQLLVQQGVTVDTQAPTLLWSTPADNDFVLTPNLGNNITLQFSEAVVKGHGYIQLWNKTTGQPVEAFDVNSSTLVTGWGTSTLTINPTANLAAKTDYFIKVSDNAIQDNSGLAYTGMNSDLPLNFSTQSADGSFAVTSSFTSASDTNAYLRSVATAGDFNGDGYDDLLIGAAGSSQSGVYVIYGNAQGEGLNLDKDPVMSNGVIAADQGFKIQGRDYFGTSVSGIGDVNGDGFADILIGASSDSQGGSNAGAAFVVYGSAAPTALNLSSGTIAAARGFKIAAGTGYGSMGNSVSGVGDFNGDGIGDFIIGYASSELTKSGGGEAYVVYGKTNASSLTFGSNGSMAAADGIRLSGAVSDRAGFSVSGAGDVNGDGLSDVIVSASGALSNADGAAYVIFGGATGGDMNALVAAGKGLKITGLTNSTGQHLGTSVSSAGDVNGDGYADLIVGTDTDQAYSAAFVVYGGPTSASVSLSAGTIAASQGFRILGNSANGAGLSQVSGAGDLNGDGFADVIVGSTGGSSYVVYGKATGAEVSVSTGTIAASEGFKLTYSTNITTTTAKEVAFAGDFDGDGLNDLVIAEGTNFGNSQTYKIVFGGTQWMTTPVIGNGAVTGTTTSEAILGSGANDTLTGGGGVDRFFAGMGNDTIVLTGTDVTNLGNVAAGQAAKSSVNGGGGFDSIRLSGGANLNLTTITNAGAMGLEENSRIESIERIDLATDTAANTLTLTAKDVNDMAGLNLIRTGSVSADGNTWTNVTGTALSASTSDHQLVVDGSTNDSLVLSPDTGYWVNAGTVSNGSSNYNVYQNLATNSQVLVKAGVVVTNNDPNAAPVFSSTNATVAAGLLPVLSSSPTWYRQGTYGTTTLGSVSTTITATGDTTPTTTINAADGTVFMHIGNQNLTETLNVSFATPVYQLKVDFSALNSDGTNSEKLSLKINGAELVLNAANLSTFTVAGTSYWPTQIVSNFIVPTNTLNSGGTYTIASTTGINSLEFKDIVLTGIPNGVGVAVSISSATLQASGGVAISALMPAATDVDGSVVGYAITSAATETVSDTTPGSWQYFNGSTWTSLSSASVSQAVYLAASTLVRWSDNDSGYTALSAVAVDNTVSATLGQALNVTTRGGATAYSSGIATLPAATFSSSAVSLALASDTGASASDFITSNGTMNVNLSVSSNTWSYSTDSGTTWTTGSGTSFVVGAGSYAANAVQVRENGSGIQTVAKFANALTVDTAAPTVAVTMSDAALTLGEKSTVTFQFSENVANFDINDVAIKNSAGGAGAGGLSALTKVSDSKWTAVYTPLTETNTMGNQIVVALNGYNDAAGNSGSTGQSTFNVDTRFSSSLTAGFYGTTSTSSSANSSVTTNAVIVDYWNPAWQGDTIITYKNGSQIDAFTISGATNSKSLGNLAASPGDVFYSTVTHNGVTYNLFNMIKVNPGTAGLTRYDSPLVLDLNGDGVQTVDISHGTMFDLQATGAAQATGWVDAHDGLLAMDLNKDGKINSGAELFGNSTLLADGQNATTGWTALAQHDSNVDGKLDAQDAVFDALMVWQDANSNGLTDAGELRSLKDVGVISINLSHDSTITHQNGNLLQGVSSYTSTDGQTHEVADAWFQTLTEGVKTPQNVESIGLQDVLTGTTSSTLPMTVNPVETLQLDAGAWTNSGRVENENGQIYVHFTPEMAHLFVDQSMSPSIL